LARLPRLSDAARATLLELLEHPVAGIRAGAAAAVSKHAVEAGVPLLMNRLLDPDTEVRSTAVRALMSMVPDTSADLVKRRMHEETNSEVASDAYYALQRAGKLTRADLLQILDSPSLDQLRSRAVYDLQWTPADHDLAARLLADPSQPVRLQAALGLLRLDMPALANVLIQRLQVEQDATIINHLLTMLGRLAAPEAADALARWVVSMDDFHRLTALEGLLRLDKKRARKLAEAMLQEALRRNASGGYLYTIASLTSSMRRTGTWRAEIRGEQARRTIGAWLARVFGAR
jgi:HEAT repeat protein